jgi:outer membrane receptor protein involved in Fe transport
MYILTGENARRLAKIDDDKSVKVAYIITKDAPNKEELEKNVPRDIIIRKVVGTNLSGDAVLNDNDNINVVTVAPVNKSLDVRKVKGVVVVKGLSSAATASSGSTVTINGVKAKPATLSYSIRSDDDAIVAEGGDVVVTGYGKKTNVKAIKVNGMSIVTNGDKDPFVVIDGKNSSMDALKKLDPDKIESISILKGDDATKKYGDKAKDGVVVIGTRKK